VLSGIARPARLRRLVLDRRPHHGRLVGRQHRLDRHQAVVAIAPRDRAPRPHVVGRLLAEALHRAQLPADQLELRRGGVARVLEQRRLGGRRGDPRDRPNLRIRQAPFAQRRIDPWQFAQRARHPHVLTCGARIPPDPPRQPARARRRARVAPVARRIERAQVGQQPVQRRVELERPLRDPIAQRRVGPPPRGGA